MTDTKDEPTALRRQAGIYADLAEDTAAAAAETAARLAKQVARYRELNGRVNVAADTLLRLYGAEVAETYLAVMFDGEPIPAPELEPTVENLLAERATTIAALRRLVGRRRARGTDSSAALLRAAADIVWDAAAHDEDSRADRKRERAALDRTRARATHLEMNAEAAVEHIRTKTRDDYAATIDLIDAEFPSYPENGTRREIAIWNHLDNIDGSHDNIKRADRRFQKLRAQLAVKDQVIEDLTRR